MNNFNIICISGISGTGKTTLGKSIIEKINNSFFIDQDSFFIKNKPKVVLSNDEIVSNWDCIDSIDWDLLNETVIEKSKTNNVVLVGFALWNEKLKFNVKKHIHLTYLFPTHEKRIDGKNYFCDELGEMKEYLIKITNENKNIIIDECSKSRLKSKNIIDDVKIKRDYLIVSECVYPFYLETLEKSEFNCILSVNKKNGKRVDINRLINYLENLILILIK